MRQQIYCLSLWTKSINNKNEYPLGCGFDAPLVLIWADVLDNREEMNKTLETISKEIFPNGEFECYGLLPMAIFDLTHEN